MIELLDANEEENCYVAMDYASIEQSHTHLEIFPSLHTWVLEHR